MLLSEEAHGEEYDPFQDGGSSSPVEQLATSGGRVEAAPQSVAGSARIGAPPPLCQRATSCEANATHAGAPASAHGGVPPQPGGDAASRSMPAAAPSKAAHSVREVPARGASGSPPTKRYCSERVVGSGGSSEAEPSPAGPPPTESQGRGAVVFVWDLDETLILFNSLLNGVYEGPAGKERGRRYVQGGAHGTWLHVRDHMGTGAGRNCVCGVSVLAGWLYVGTGNSANSSNVLSGSCSKCATAGRSSSRSLPVLLVCTL